MNFGFEDTLYVKGSNEVKIYFLEEYEKKFLAVTAPESNWYETWIGAENFMESCGYVKVTG